MVPRWPSEHHYMARERPFHRSVHAFDECRRIVWKRRLASAPGGRSKRSRAASGWFVLHLRPRCTAYANTCSRIFMTWLVERIVVHHATGIGRRIQVRDPVQHYRFVWTPLLQCRVRRCTGGGRCDDSRPSPRPHRRKMRTWERPGASPLRRVMLPPHVILSMRATRKRRVFPRQAIGWSERFNKLAEWGCEQLVNRQGWAFFVVHPTERIAASSSCPGIQWSKSWGERDSSMPQVREAELWRFAHKYCTVIYITLQILRYRASHFVSIPMT